MAAETDEEAAGSAETSGSSQSSHLALARDAALAFRELERGFDGTGVGPGGAFDPEDLDALADKEAQTRLRAERERDEDVEAPQPLSEAGADSAALQSLLETHQMHPSQYEATGTEPHLSKIARSTSWHVRKLTQVKDLLVPSGPQGGPHDAIFNLVNCIVGAGMLGLPITFVWSGYVLQSAIIVGVVAAMYGTAVLLLDAARATGRSSMEDIAKVSLGRYGGAGVDFLIAMGNFFALIAYCQLLADFSVELLTIITGSDSINRATTLIGITLIFPYPLSLMPNLNSLRFTSFLSVLGMVAFGIFLLVEILRVVFSSSLSLGPGIVPITFNGGGFLKGLPIVVFACGCHPSLLPIYTEQREEFKPTFAQKSMRPAFTFAAVMYLVAGVCGYLLFGEETADSILVNFEGRGGALIPIFAIFTIIIGTTYPLLAFVARVAIENLAWGDKEEIKAKRGWFIETWLYVLAVGVALATDDISMILSLGGALSTSLLALTLPGIVFLTEVHGYTLPWIGTKSARPRVPLCVALSDPKSYLAFGAIIAGILLAIGGATSSIVSVAVE
jgi:amino acid permease